MPPHLALAKRGNCILRGKWSPINPNRPACLSRDDEIAIMIVGVIGGLTLAWCMSVWLWWAWRSRQRTRRLQGTIPAFPPLRGIFSRLSGSSGTHSPPSTQDHASYPLHPASEEENTCRSYAFQPDMATSRPMMEARFSLPLLSAGGDLLPDPAAIARVNRQASLPETPERALPITPVPQCNITKPVRVFYEARDVYPQTNTTRSVSPGTVIEDDVFANSLVRSMVGSGRSQQPSTPLRGEYSQGLEYQPYGYQAQSYSPVPGFNSTYRKVSTTPTFEMDPLQANASQPSSPLPSPTMLRHHGYTQVPSESLLRSPLASPTNSKITSRSLRSSLRIPPSRSESRSVESHGSSLVQRAPGPFPWAASAPTTNPSHSASKYMSPVASPSRQPNHVIVAKDPVTGRPDVAAPPINKPPAILAAPTSGLVPSTMTRVLNPPTRSSSHVPAKDPQPQLRGPVAERRHLPLQAPKPSTPPKQLLSQRAMKFDTFSESGDGHNSLSSRRQERQELSPWASLSLVGHVVDSDLTRHHKRLAESLSAPTHAWEENLRKDRRGG